MIIFVKKLIFYNFWFGYNPHVVFFCLFLLKVKSGSTTKKEYQISSGNDLIKLSSSLFLFFILCGQILKHY